MSSHDTNQEGPAARRSPLITSLEWLWRRYSPNGELPISSAMSMGLHILLFALIPLLAYSVMPPDVTQPTTGVVHVADNADAAPSEDPSLLADAGLQANSTTEPLETPKSASSEQLENVEEIKPLETEAPVEQQREKLQEQVGQARRAAAAAAASLQNAKQKLNENLNQGTQGSGGGGTASEGRGARPSRWVLLFNSRSTQDYLAQFEGLGAAIAFPAQGEMWRYYPKPSSSPGTLEMRNLDNENRLYWVDENAQDVQRVAQALGAGSATHMIAFLPIELEDKMLRMELAYNNLNEDEIASTHFRVVSRGGGYDVQVERQIEKQSAK